MIGVVGEANRAAFIEGLRKAAAQIKAEAARKDADGQLATAASTVVVRQS